ncbi:MAG: c-type cytochrome, partial [Solirubrobacterales bacterium]|nr:c-type cytochrome [Solirubrobacterales bacterium]
RRRQYDALAVRVIAITTLAVAAAFGLSACGFGEEGITVSKDSPDYEGAQLFAANCAGCHTLTPAGGLGTGNRGTRTQGPNLDQRTETYESALHAIQNGGFSGAIMPQNIVVGEEAEKVANFVADYAGSDAGEAGAEAYSQEEDASSEQDKPTNEK